VIKIRLQQPLFPLQKGFILRPTHFGIDEQFLKRFSPRSFSSEPIDESDLKALLEAATTAPSCFNEQPWYFVIGDKEDFLSILTEKNAAWAKSAAAFVLIASRREFSRNAKPNRWHAFDCGTAMGYMILEALRRNIYAHPMAGFNAARAAELFGLEKLELHTVVALGYSDESHSMTTRKPMDEIVVDRRSR